MIIERQRRRFLAKPVGEQSDEHDADDREANQLGHVSANERGHGRIRSGGSVDGRTATPTLLASAEE